MALKNFYTVAEIYNMTVTNNKLKKEIELDKKDFKEYQKAKCWKKVTGKDFSSPFMRKVTQKMIEKKENLIEANDKILSKVLDKNNMEETQKRMDLIMHYIITGKDGNEKFYVA